MIPGIPAKDSAISCSSVTISLTAWPDTSSIRRRYTPNRLPQLQRGRAASLAICSAGTAVPEPRNCLGFPVSVWFWACWFLRL